MIADLKDAYKKALSRGAVLIATSLYCPLIVAQAELGAARERVEPLSAEHVVKTLLGLILVIGVIVGLAWLVRRMGRMSGMVSGQIKIVSALSVGTREKLLLVQVGDEQFLLGATQTHINRIARLRAPLEAAVPVTTGGEPLTFQSLFAKLKHAKS